MQSSGFRPPRVDPLEHFDHLHVRPAVQRSPQGADARGARGKHIGLGRAHQPHGRGAAILLVVGVQDEDQVQRVLHFPRHDVLAVGDREHHVQEIGAVAQVGIGIGERQAQRAAVGEGGDRADLADQPCGGFLERLVVFQGEELLVMAGQVAQGGREDGHRRGIRRNVLELVLQALVQQLVGRQKSAEPLEFVGVRQPPEDQQPGRLDEIGLVGELLDRDAPVAKYALVAVEEGDRAATDARIAQGTGRTSPVRSGRGAW